VVIVEEEADATGTQQAAKFPENYETDPPVPVEAKDQVASCATGRDSIPDGFVADEHVTKVRDYTVMRAGVDCPRCDSNVFFHPKSISPTNTVKCFNCQWAPLGIAWWETPRLSSFS
jgi:hypothetical protein